MQKNIYIGAAVVGVLVLLVLLGGGLGQNGASDMAPETQTEMPPAGSESESGIVVTYTADGYVPSTVTVPVGTTVTFANESNTSMWTASDPHPVHTTLPAFDPLEGVPSGESYSYTFTEPGEWGYHNHLLASHTGVVIVE